MTSFINLIAFAFYIHKLPLIRQIRAGAVSQLEEYLPGMQKALQNHGVMMHTYNLSTGHIHTKGSKCQGQDEGDCSGVKSICCSSRGPGFTSQHPHERSQPLLIPGPGAAVPSSDTQRHGLDAQIYM